MKNTGMLFPTMTISSDGEEHWKGCSSRRKEDPPTSRALISAQSRGEPSGITDAIRTASRSADCREPDIGRGRLGRIGQDLPKRQSILSSRDLMTGI